jgi:Pectate lyase superfamily protein
MLTGVTPMSPLRAPLLPLLLLFTTAACGSAESPSLAVAGAGGMLPDAGSTASAAGGSTATAGGSSSSDGGAPSTSSGSTGGSGGAMPSCVSAADSGLGKSQWVYRDAGGKLVYKTLPTGEQILDFSYAGYEGGGVAIPIVPVKQTVNPSGKDDTAAIQAAIDAVSALAPVNGLRGAVLLAPGTFTVSAQLTISTSGVVLRGSGSGAGGTTLKLSGAPRAAIAIHGTGSWKEAKKAATVTDAYVPSGARSFHVDSAAGLSVGAAVLIDRTVTGAWVHFMGMDKLVRDGKPQTWIAAGTVIHTDRVITAIAGDEITVDAPIPDSYDAKYTSPPGVTVAPYTFDGRLAEVGLEAMRIVAPKQSVPISSPIFSILDMNAVENGWVKDIAAEEFTNGFSLGSTTKWITIEDSSVTRTAPIDGSAGYPFSYAIDGQLTLVLRSSAKGDKVFSYATQARSPGPNAVLHFSASGNWTSLQPHQRWATGLLLDNIDSPGGSIDLLDRGYYGSGHGWTMGFGVVWNAVAAQLTIQQPPGAENWAIGSSGMLVPAAEPGSSDTTPLPSGIIDSAGTPVAPESLYLAQLCERLGPGALANIGY